ncbi:MAG: hypothetical protein WAN39_11200 [Candidatus Cybelea sp.]|jgi:hypothetical protein
MRVPALLLAMAIALACAVLPPAGLARPHPSPSPSPTPIADPQITLLARQQFVAWQAGEINQHLYAQQVLDKLSDAKISETSHALGQLGALTDTVFIGPWEDPSFPSGARGYIYQMHCVEGNIYLWLALDPQGKIATIFFKNRLDTETVTPSPKPS